MPCRSRAVLMAAYLLTSPLVATAQNMSAPAAASTATGGAKPVNPDQESTPKATAPATATTGTAAMPAAAVAPPASTKSGGPASAPVLSRRLEPVDRRFLEDAVQGGLREIEFGKLAAQQASDPAVKSFGELMVTEHTETGQKLAALAQGKGLASPAQLAPADAKRLEALRKLSGARFDKAYIDGAVRGHVIEVKSFDRQAKATHDPDVRTFATESSPIVHRHLDLASDVQKHLGKPPPVPMTPKGEAPAAAKADEPPSAKGEAPMAAKIDAPAAKGDATSSSARAAPPAPTSPR